jgi:hypothetical protein
VITNEGDEDDEESGGHKRLVFRFYCGEKEESKKELLFICAANMAVCQDIAPVSLRHGRQRIAIHENTCGS